MGAEYVVNRDGWRIDCPKPFLNYQCATIPVVAFIDRGLFCLAVWLTYTTTLGDMQGL
jgi:hypothetical protein